MVAEYAQIPLPQVGEFDLFEFWAILRDAVIYNHAQTEKGRKWLDDAWRLTQTEPETEKLREKFGKKG